VPTASLTAPQIAGERCVWNTSRRTDLRTPAENHPDGAIPNHLPASDLCPVTAMTLKVSGRAYTPGGGLRERLLDVPRDRLGLTGTGRAGLLAGPEPGHLLQPEGLTAAGDHTGRAVTAHPAAAGARGADPREQEGAACRSR
jgi:hypothetical protein